MEIDKKKLLKLIKENLKEMAMEFDPSLPARPDPGIERKLQQKDTPLKKVPLPSTNEPNKNFQELLASERYKQVVERIRQYTNQNPNVRGMEGMFPLISMMMNAHNAIVRIESAHREELEKLAVELVMNEMGIPEGSVEFDAKIVGMGEIDSTDFNKEEGQTENPEEVNLDVEVELLGDLEKLNLEKAKRRMINAIIQGASKRGHYMYHLVSDKLREVTGSNELLNLYGVMMSVNDINYWQMSDEQIRGMGNSVAGKENVERPEDEDGTAKVVARGINFPVLVHELIKGVLELFAIQGRPEGEEGFEDVESSEDTLEKEMWDLRLGPPIWDRIRSQFPERILRDDSKKELQNYILTNIFKLPAKEFFVFLKEVVSGSERGKTMMDDFVTGIEMMLNNQEYESSVEEFRNDLEQTTNETDDDDLYGFLDSLGIDRPKDN
jgi:hypothetical protein